MASHLQAKQELLELLSAACDGWLDDTSFARLESLLAERDEHCRLLVSYGQLHADLLFLVAANKAERRALSVLPTVESPTDNGTDAPLAGHRLGGRGVRSQLLLLVTLAAGLLLPIWLATNRDDAQDDSHPIPLAGSSDRRIRLVRLPEQVACITNSAEAVWRQRRDRAVGKFFSQGDRLELTAGTVQLSMTSGVDIVLQAPCTLVLLSENLVRLEKGKLTAHAAKWATGFTVETRGLKITDLGTRFAVAAEADSTEAHVLEGSVLAEPLQPQPQNGSRLLLNSGQAIRVDLLRSTFDRLATQHGRFIEETKDFRPFRRIVMHNTGASLSIGDVDPHWTITAGDSSMGPWPQAAVVGQPDIRYSDNAPEKSQWISVEEGTTKGLPPSTQYTFETTFDLTGFDLATVSLVGQIIADNGVQEIRLNGQRVDVSPWIDNEPGQQFMSFHAAEIRSGFVAGVNRLEIDVYNGIFNTGSPEDRRKPNPMALRVEWQAFGREARPDLRPLRDI